MPLSAAASKLEPSNQSPQTPTLAIGSKIHGTPGVFVGNPAPLQVDITINLVVQPYER